MYVWWTILSIKLNHCFLYRDLSKTFSRFPRNVISYFAREVVYKLTIWILNRFSNRTVLTSDQCPVSDRFYAHINQTNTYAQLQWSPSVLFATARWASHLNRSHRNRNPTISICKDCSMPKHQHTIAEEAKPNKRWFCEVFFMRFFVL